MEKHQGAILEKVVRNSDVSISELARILVTNRRTVYYWFTQQSVSKRVIEKVGEALFYDFSNDFPDYNTSSNRKELSENIFAQPFRNISSGNNLEFWKDKYLNLLEEYNSLILQKSA